MQKRFGEVNHILFADDVVIFCDACEVQVGNLLAILICFETVSGLKVNVHKSVIFTLGDVGEAHRYADILGCSIGSFPSSYLGLPLGIRSPSSQIWEPVVVNIRKKLESWRAKFLSFGGRITLLRSVLSSSRFTSCLFFVLLLLLFLRSRRFNTFFMWEGVGEDRKPHLVRWSMVKVSRRKGGLKVLNLRNTNLALLGKWGWRYATEKNAWWRNLIVDKCGVGSSEWKTIWNLQGVRWSVWGDIVKSNPRFWEFTTIDPGGGGVSFWYDYWVLGECLDLRLPRIFAAAQSKDALLSQSVVISDRYDWNFGCVEELRMIGGGCLIFSRPSRWDRLHMVLPSVVGSSFPQAFFR
ncbi:Putative ribonuclease H protein At1g65750 [Linum perenne]